MSRGIPEDIIDSYKNYIGAHSKYGKMLLHYLKDYNLRIGLVYSDDPDLSMRTDNPYKAIICNLTDEGYWYYNSSDLEFTENIDGLPLENEQVFLFKDLKLVIYIEDILVDGPILCLPIINTEKMMEFEALNDKIIITNFVFGTKTFRNSKQRYGIIDIVGSSHNLDRHLYKESICVRIINVYNHDLDINFVFGMIFRLNSIVSRYCVDLDAKFVDIIKTEKSRSKYPIIRKYKPTQKTRRSAVRYGDIRGIYFSYSTNMGFLPRRLVCTKTIYDIVSLLKRTFLRTLEQHLEYYTGEYQDNGSGYGGSINVIHSLMTK